MSIVMTYANSDALAQAAAEHFMDIAVSSFVAHGRFSVALSGGSTPRLTYERLATRECSSRVDWSHVYLFWGDERCVPPDRADSNYGMVRGALIDRVPIPSANVHRIEGEIEPAEAAARYEETLRQFFSRAGQEETRTFDLVLLGMGTDGHTASLFPNTEVLDERVHWVAAHYAGEAQGWRVTLTPPSINAARHVTFLVSGAAKAQTLRSVLMGPCQPDLLPAQIVEPPSGNLLWLLDSAAAALL
jgi:6-phosphogluconolactonase